MVNGASLFGGYVVILALGLVCLVCYIVYFLLKKAISRVGLALYRKYHWFWYYYEGTPDTYYWKEIEEDRV